MPTTRPVRTVSRELVRPRLTALADSWGETGTPCTEAEGLPAGFPGTCTVLGTSGTPRKHLWVIGDSHAAQLLTAIGPIAEGEGWKVTFLRRNQCRFQAPGSGDGECDAFNRAAATFALANRPDALLVVGSISREDGIREMAAPGLMDALQPFFDAQVPVVSFRDNPRFPSSRAGCVDRHGTTAAKCSSKVEDVLLPEDPVASLAAGQPLLTRVDPTPLYCPGGTCPAVIGNVLVYLDNNHLTSSYLKTAIPELRSMLLDALPAGFGTS